MASRTSSRPTGPEPDELLYSDISKLWANVRDTVESFAQNYFAPSAPPKRLTAQQWMESNADLTLQLWRLWLKGLGIAGREGYRLSNQAIRRPDDGPRSDELRDLIEAEQRAGEYVTRLEELRDDDAANNRGRQKSVFDALVAEAEADRLVGRQRLELALAERAARQARPR